jgi:hypothetical protein
MKTYIKHIIPVAALLLMMGMASCTKDLDVTPIDPNYVEPTPEQLYNKCFATMATAGNDAADGDSDVDGIDGGTSGYFRQMWNEQELTTDEVFCAWGDEGIAGFVYNTYDASHPMLRGFYYRLYVAITFCNQYLQEYGDYNPQMTAEIRFLRAYHYYHLVDGWGSVPFVTAISSEKPQQASRSEIYNFIESELIDIDGQLSAPKAKKSTDAGYGRPDRAAAWLLLARLYLNAEVYTGTAQWGKAAEYAQKVMSSDYQLNTNAVGVWSAYRMLFMGDNGETDAAKEILFPLLQDGKRTTSWGCALYLIAAPWKSDLMFEHPTDPSQTNGTTAGWQGHRARRQLVEKFFPNGDAPLGKRGFEMTKEAGDDRALFSSVDRTLDIDEVSVFENGFGYVKFTNFKTDGSTGHDPQHPDMDVPLMRKAEAYLIYAEATARQSGGNATSDGVNALNTLRQRANASAKSSFTLNDICDEWSREFYAEGLRRSTLIRFGKFGGTTDYQWQWKGGSHDGRDFAATRNLFPIPTTDLVANSNLTQNPGY